jgi:hypothetical protein
MYPTPCSKATPRVISYFNDVRSVIVTIRSSATNYDHLGTRLNSGQTATAECPDLSSDVTCATLLASASVIMVGAEPLYLSLMTPFRRNSISAKSHRRSQVEDQQAISRVWDGLLS